MKGQTLNRFQIRSFNMHENWLGTNFSGSNLIPCFFRATPDTNFEQRRIHFGILDDRAYPSGSDLDRSVSEERF
jgi:hypothetical protein